jgi:hypothetical protein
MGAQLLHLSGRRTQLIYRTIQLLFMLLLGITGDFSYTMGVIHADSFTVKMEVLPQTVTNVLSPYRMIYDLVANDDNPIFCITRFK